MANEPRVGDMTLEELKVFIQETVREEAAGFRKLGGTRSVQEINDSIRRHRWTPPPGAKSSLELLREDRER